MRRAGELEESQGRLYTDTHQAHVHDTASARHSKLAFNFFAGHMDGSEAF